MTPSDPYDELVAAYTREHLGDKTIKDRRLLLILCSIGLFVWLSGITPERVPLLGIEFRVADQIAMVKFLAVVLMYQTVVFGVHAWRDFEEHRATIRKPLALERSAAARE